MTSLGTVPGLVEAYNALGATIDNHGRVNMLEVVEIVMAISRPHVQAELLADLADEFAEIAPDFAHMLDQISHEMRKEVSRWPTTPTA